MKYFVEHADKSLEFNISEKEDQVKVLQDEKEMDISIVPLGFNRYLIKKGNKIYRCLHHLDNEQFILDIRGNRIAFKIKNEREKRLEGLVDKSASIQRDSKVKAPISGLVVKLEVEAGDKVVNGQPLLILEAMKMENSLNAPFDGVIESIKVVEGETVTLNQVLIILKSGD